MTPNDSTEQGMTEEKARLLTHSMYQHAHDGAFRCAPCQTEGYLERVEQENGKLYPHMCRLDHEEIGHKTDDEMCPVCKRDGLIAELTEALKKIRRDEGKVCSQYEICEHAACGSSYNAWAISDEALASAREQEKKQ